MKNITEYLKESLIKESTNYSPRNKRDLLQIIKKLLKDGNADLNSIDTSMITDMSHLFYDVRSEVKRINISDWDVSNVTNMSDMFFKCENLESVGNLANWDVSKVKDMHTMFADCVKLKDIGDISAWDVTYAKDNMDNMFYKSGIKDIPSWAK